MASQPTTEETTPTTVVKASNDANHPFRTPLTDHLNSLPPYWVHEPITSPIIRAISDERYSGKYAPVGVDPNDHNGCHTSKFAHLGQKRPDRHANRSADVVGTTPK